MEKLDNFSELIGNFRLLKNRVFHIIFVAFLALFLLPGVSRACGAKATGIEKAKCAKGKAKKSHGLHILLSKKSCDPKSGHAPCGNDCGGKCGHNSCKCMATCSSSATVILFDVKSDAPLTGSQDQNSLLKPAHISSGFYSIWLPPKIS